MQSARNALLQASHQACVFLFIFFAHLLEHIIVHAQLHIYANPPPSSTTSTTSPATSAWDLRALLSYFHALLNKRKTENVVRSYSYCCANAGILEGEIFFFSASHLMLLCCVLLRVSFWLLFLLLFLSATSVCVCVSFKLPIMCDIEVVLFMVRKKEEKKHTDDEWREWKVQNIWIAFVSPVRSCECCQYGAMMLPCVYLNILFKRATKQFIIFFS